MNQNPEQLQQPNTATINPTATEYLASENETPESDEEKLEGDYYKEKQVITNNDQVQILQESPESNSYQDQLKVFQDLQFGENQSDDSILQDVLDYLLYQIDEQEPENVSYQDDQYIE